MDRLLVVILPVVLCCVHTCTAMPRRDNAEDTVDFVLCIPGHYYNKENRECTTCSECPVNQIVIQLCTISQDTICGPFNEFKSFNQGSEPLDKILDREWFKNLGNTDKKLYNKLLSVRGSSTTTSTTPTHSVSAGGCPYWHTAVIMIAFLFSVALIATAFTLYIVCFILPKQGKSLTCCSAGDNTHLLTRLNTDHAVMNEYVMQQNNSLLPITDSSYNKKIRIFPIEGYPDHGFVVYDA